MRGGKIKQRDIRQMSDVEAAWAAGLFDGEGSIHLYFVGKHGPYVDIKVDMSDEDVVSRMAQVTGLSCARPLKNYSGNENDKPMFQWRTNGMGALRVLLRLYPYLGLRRRAKVEEVLSLLAPRYFPGESVHSLTVDIGPPVGILTESTVSDQEAS